MGTPVSKNERVSAEDNTGESNKKRDEAGSLNQNDGRKCDQKNIVSGKINTEILNESHVTQVLCADDDVDDDGDADSIEEQEWGDIFKRLKTNYTDDLHILNTRFNVNDIKNLPDAGKRSTGPILTSTVADRPTRITSANYNPHAVTVEREKSRTKSAFRRKSYTMEYNSTENSTLDSADGYESLQSGDNEIFETSGMNKNKLSANIQDENNKENITTPRSGTPLFHGQICLDVQNDLRVIQSPVPKICEGDCWTSEGSDIDPFEGLDIPRERVYSFGTVSAYSVQEICDDVYNQFKTEIKNCIRSYGFFEAFPSPTIIREAQKIYRRLDLPSPVDNDGNVLPHPPKITKSEYLAAESNTLKEARVKIENIPESLQLNGDMVDIVHYLCEGLDNDMTKLTLLSTWIVYQQLKGTESNKCKTREEWSRQLQTMCKFAKLKTKLVKGIIRGPTFTPGDALDRNHGHWLAILINYVWILLDPFIHRVKLDSESKTKDCLAVENGKNLLNLVEQMFKDPEDFIFTHYPDDEHWQLLARPVTQMELSDLAVLRSGFFTYDMTILNCPKSVIVVKNPETVISLAFDKDNLLQFKCRFQLCDNSMSLMRARTYVFLETIMNQHKVNVRVRFPKKGSHILDILGFSEEHMWKNVVSFKLVYEGEHFSKPFPDNQREEWGPGMDALKLGLTPSLYHSGEILMQKGVLQIAFRGEKRLQLEYILYKEDVNIKTDSWKVNLLKDKNNDIVFVVDIDTKIIGMFMLQLSARVDASSCVNFCNYLIRKEKTVVIPKLEFNDKSLSADSKKTAVYAPENGNLHFTVDTNGLIQLTVELKLHDKQELNLSDHTRHWIDENTGQIELNLPRIGKYTLQVCGREIDKGRKRPILEETIQVAIPSEKWSCFPKVGNNWNSWYKIESPLSHHLEEKRDVTYKIIVQNALDVAVHGANGWFHLDRVGESWIWVGHVRTGPKSTRCRLLARFDIGSDRWSELLLFKIMAADDFERMIERQNEIRKAALDDRKIRVD